MAIRTIFSMAEDCARGERLGWLEFVRDFAGIARALLAHYFPTLAPDLNEHMVAVFRRAGAHGGSWFAGLGFSNEREFMMAFRDLVFAYGREQERMPAPEIALEQVRAIMKDLTLLERQMLWLIIKGYDGPRIAAIMMNAAATAEAVQRIADERLAPQPANTGRAGDPGAPAPPIALDQLRAIMQDLMLLEREVLWLFIKGYDAQRIAAIMMNAAATAEAVRRVAGERLQALLPGAAQEALIVSARVLMEMAEQSKTDSCVSLKTFNSLVNGQLTWRERELAGEHMSNCFYCIDRFTTFQEMVRLRKDTSQITPPQVEAILVQLPFAAGKPRGVLSRLFAGR